MTESKKIPGLLKDPWRTATAPAEVRKIAAVSKNKPGAMSAPQQEDVVETETRASIDVKDYGGITVDGVSTSAEAATRLLAFCIDHNDEIEKTFTEYGIVIAQMPVVSMTGLKFYLQRKDGWLLAIPGVPTRESGCVQLVQAMLKLYTNNDIKKKLERYKIRPYKV